LSPIYLAAFAAAALLSACGGGGGSDSASGAPSLPAPGNSLGITSSNYQQVAEVSLASSAYLLDTGSFGLGGGPGARSAASPRLAQAQQGQEGRALPLGTSTNSLSCAQGGSLFVSFNDQNNNANLDAGDSLSIDARSCREDGQLLQGGLSMTAKTFSGSFGGSSFSGALQMGLSDFTVTEGSDRTSASGSFELQVAVGSGNSELNLVVDKLTLSGVERGLIFSHQVQDARLSLRSNAAGVSTSSIAATVSSNRLDGKSVRIETLNPLTLQPGADYPSGGQLVISGDARSKLRLTPQSATQVLLEVDADGDGTFEGRYTKAWSELY
jgi:hypothetical protein